MNTGTAAAPTKRPEIIEKLREGLVPVITRTLTETEKQIQELGQVAGCIRDLLALLGTDEVEAADESIDITEVTGTEKALAAVSGARKIYSRNYDANVFRQKAVAYLLEMGPSRAVDVARACEVSPSGATIRMQDMKRLGLVKQDKATRLPTVMRRWPV